MNNQTKKKRRLSRPFAALIGLNAALLLALGAVTFGPSVDAQSRTRGSYTMVAGGANNLESDAVYIVDVVNEQLLAVGYDQSSKKLKGLGARSIARDAARLQRGK